VVVVVVVSRLRLVLAVLLVCNRHRLA